jgi:asparagine synthase (glutamine-hydrolysing)
MIAEAHQGRMVAFTTTSERGPGDETENVLRLLSRYPQFELVKVPLGVQDLERAIARVVYHMDEPFIWDSPFVRWQIAAAIHQHGFKVSVTGEGADELIGGYPVSSHLFLIDLLRKHAVPRLAFELAFTLRQPDWRPILSRFVAQFVKSKRDWLRDYLVENARHMGCRMPPRSDGAPKLKEHDLSLKEKLQSQVTTFFLPYLLTCNDKMYMAHAVEARAPFLDVEVVEQLLAIPTERLIVRGIRKYPLRHAMQGRVPESVLYDRRKIGFDSPMRTELSSPSSKAWVRSLFSAPRSEAFVDPKAFLAAYEALPNGTAVNDFALQAVNLEIWMREFDVAPE